MNALKLKWIPALLSSGLLVTGMAAHADERESLENLRQTTIKLIQAMVSKGVLTQAQAEDMLKQAAAPTASADAGKAQADAKSDKPVIRIPYVPQPVKDQIRAEVKEEVLAQAKAERWGVPNATAEWTDRIKIDGDMRFRYQQDRFGQSNALPRDYYQALFDGFDAHNGAVTRWADVLPVGSALINPTANTTEDRTLWRTRFRLGVTAKVSDMVSVGARLATGNTTDRVSTNQTLGQNFNKYSIFLDRAYLRLEPVEGVVFSAGRIANPWFSTDLIWSENLNFEGMALTAKWPTAPDDVVQPFATVGYFPIRADNPPKQARSLTGVQAGMQLNFSSTTRLKLGVAQYSYNNIEGRPDEDYTLANGAGASYGQYEYEAGLRQKGNTLFLTNNLNDSSTTNYWGLASKFRPMTVTGALELGQFNPFFIMLSAEYVKNTAFSRKEIEERTTIKMTDGRADGYLLRGVFGAKEIRYAYDWQLSLTYRVSGSESVLDAFTDSDPALGGTNNKGYVLGASLGLDKNTSLSARYLSSQALQSPLALTGSSLGSYKVNTLQVDLNVRF
jgi:hypothetical protein